MYRMTACTASKGDSCRASVFGPKKRQQVDDMHDDITLTFAKLARCCVQVLVGA